tara:strand:+ start:7668 stop:8717 length:1050 start_codon:yes stop_codon:yes gene_type:complete
MTMAMDYSDLSILDDSPEEEITVNPAISVAEATDVYGKFVIGPLDPGYGVTLGNPLRRVLYNSLKGTAITWVKIETVLHEYSTIPNIKEEVSEILLNLKDVRIRSEVDTPGKLRLEGKGKGVITAADIMASADYTVVNPEQHIATLDSDDAELILEINVSRGSGYQVAESSQGYSIGTIPIDSIFTPVKKVNFSVEQTRVGQRTDFEELILEVWTDGSTYPVEAVAEAANILVNQFFLFANVEKAAEEGSEGISLDIPAENYNMVVEDLELSSRTLNCLKRAGLNRVGEVLEKTKDELLQIRNFGEKSYTELYDKFREIGVLPEHLDPDSESFQESETDESESDMDSSE